MEHSKGPFTAEILIGVAALLISASVWTRLPTEPVGCYLPSVRGATMVDWTADGYRTATAESSLAALAATGANTVVIVVTAYPSSPGSSRLRVGDPRTPTTRDALGLAFAATLNAPIPEMRFGVFRM